MQVGHLKIEKLNTDCYKIWIFFEHWHNASNGVFHTWSHAVDYNQDIIA